MVVEFLQGDRDWYSVRYCTVAYTSITFYQVSEKHSHVFLVGLYQTLI